MSWAIEVCRGQAKKRPDNKPGQKKDKKKETHGTAGLSQDEGGSDSIGTVLRLSG